MRPAGLRAAASLIGAAGSAGLGASVVVESAAAAAGSGRGAGAASRRAQSALMRGTSSSRTVCLALSRLPELLGLVQ